MSDNLEAVVKSVNEITAKLDANYATKSDLAKLADGLKELNRISAENCARNRKHKVFGDEYVAHEFVDFLGGIIKAKGLDKRVSIDPSYQLEKATLNVTTTTAGGYLVPTAVSPILEGLVSLGAKARQFHDVYPLGGPLDIGVADTQAVATYTTNDTTAISETDRTFSKVTLSPKQLGALFRASGKLLNESAVPVASMIVENLAAAAGVLEDQTVLYGDGTATYSSQTGYEDNTSITGTSVASVSALTIDNLLGMQDDISDAVELSECSYYMPRALIAALRQKKGTANDHYYFDLQTRQFTIGGAPVVEWNRMHSGTNTGDMVALFGNLRKAGKIGVGRQLSIDVDSSVDFAKAGFVWRLLEDFGFVIPNPGAVSKVRIGSTT